jgi:hypothetical protein
MNRFVPRLRPLVAALLVFFCSGAHAENTYAIPPIVDTAMPLGAGEFVWKDSATPGQVSIVVSVALQRLYVYRTGVLVGMTTVSTGKRGHATPLGDYAILQKSQWHRSNLYSDAPMPFMQRLTWDGIAIHGGWNPGYPASHGCIRVPAAFARKLFVATSLGATVAVTDHRTQPPIYLEVEGMEYAERDDLYVSTGDDWAGQLVPASPPVRDQQVRLAYSPLIFQE